MVASWQMESSGVMDSLHNPYSDFICVRLSVGGCSVLSASCAAFSDFRSSSAGGSLPMPSLPSSLDASTASPFVLTVRECCPADLVTSSTLYGHVSGSGISLFSSPPSGSLFVGTPDLSEYCSPSSTCSSS